jgi:thiamine biosynthesis protein ThiS
MEIRVNGQCQQVAEGTSLSELLAQLKLNRQLVAVEVNTELVAREHHDEYVLQPGDLLEIVTLVGGG